MLTNILPKYSVSRIMGYLIRESAPINGHDGGRPPPLVKFYR